MKSLRAQGQTHQGPSSPTYEMKQAGPIYAWAYKELQDAQKPDLYVLIGTAHPASNIPWP